MQEPIDYLAVVELQRALQGICQADGYYYDVRGTAVKQNPNHGTDVLAEPDRPQPVIALEVHPERRDYSSSMVTVHLPIDVHWICDSNPERDVDMLRTFFRGAADIERAVKRAEIAGASEIRVISCENNRTEDGSQVWAVVRVEIWINRTYGEPSQ